MVLNIGLYRLEQLDKEYEQLKAVNKEEDQLIIDHVGKRAKEEAEDLFNLGVRCYLVDKWYY